VTREGSDGGGQEQFDDIVASLDARMVVVTTAAGGERAGCLVGFHTQSSIDPPRYAFWLSKANHTYRVGLLATHFGIHFLSAEDAELAELFGTRTGDDVDKFAGLDVVTGPAGVPVLAHCPHRLVVRRIAELDEGGDHVCITSEVVETHSPGRFSPLLLSQVEHLNPGHEAEERQTPPTELGPAAR
jgi:flavin reductase (DIM6/NTAB) family NADH-FMN oxidoreductase RutF